MLFRSLGSFSTRFTQLVGETPTAYRDRWAALGGPRVPGCYLFMHGPGRLGQAGGQQVRNLRVGPAGPPGLGSEP